MATFNKFNAFVADVGNKVHNLGSDTLKIMLSNVAPVATNAVKADITDIGAGNGYSAGGTAVGSTAYAQTSGTGKLTGNAVVFTASGGAIASFRYAVLYNSTAAGGPLIGWWDYGSSIGPLSGETFTVASDTAGTNWTSGAPILTLV
jgi:hypothetical protein